MQPCAPLYLHVLFLFSLYTYLLPSYTNTFSDRTVGRRLSGSGILFCFFPIIATNPASKV